MKLRGSLLLLMGVSVALPFTLPGARKPPQKPSRVVLADPGSKKETQDGASEKVAAANAPGEFRLPEDRGGKLLAQVLRPSLTDSEPREKKPRPRPAPRSIEEPVVALPPQLASLPRLPDAGPRKPPLPQLLAPELFPGVEELFAGLPQLLVLPALDRVKIASPDVNVPISLPRMAQPLSDRAPTTDPTLEVSKSNVLAAPLPVRERPAPFQRETLPDPYENHDTVRLSKTPGEEPFPDTTVSPPRK